MIELREARVGILGLGQIGGSLAQALKLRSAVAMISGYDRDPELVVAALQRHMIDHIARSDEELIELSDVVIVALPMSGIFETVKSRATQFREKQLVTDTGSLKQQVVELAEQVGLANFVGGHPLAGTEKRGQESWNGNLFVGANYFHAAPVAVQAEKVELFRRLVEAIDASPISVDPVEHDHIFSTTSNLPHLFAYCLMDAFADLDGSQQGKNLFRCPSFNGASRIASSDPEMVFQMLWYNRENLRGSLKRLLGKLREAQSALSDDDEESFRKIFGTGLARSF